MGINWNDLVTVLGGRWEGEGAGGFPDIDDFRYRETLEFQAVDGREELICRQNTFKYTEDGPQPSHLEVGLLFQGADGQIAWNNVQSGGRVEVSRLDAEQSYHASDETRLVFVTTGLFNDPKERAANAATRVFTIQGGSLTYRLAMGTTARPLGPHLEATLQRQ